MTKSMWVAVIVLFLLFTGCGFFIWMLQKEEIKQDVQHFLVRHRLQNSLSYESVSFSVADVIALKGLELKLYDAPDLKNKIDTVTIHSYREERRIPAVFSATASGVRFSLLEVAKALDLPEETVVSDLSGFDPAAGLVSHPLFAFLLAGCDNVNATVRVDYAYAPLAKELLLKIDASDACLGRWEFETLLTNITNAQQGQLVLALKHIVQRGSVARNISEMLDGAGVVRLNFSYTEKGLVKGYKNFVDTLYLRMPGQDSPAELDVKDVQKVVTYLSFSNAHRQRNADLVNTFAQFVKNPEKLTVQSKLGKNVSLKALSGSFVRRLTDLLLRLDVSLVNEVDSAVF